MSRKNNWGVFLIKDNKIEELCEIYLTRFETFYEQIERFFHFDWLYSI